VFPIPFAQELSNELPTIRKLLARVATHAAANMPEKSTPQATRDSPRCMALFAATLATRRPFKLHTVPPHPPSVGTPIAARDTVADRMAVDTCQVHAEDDAHVNLAAAIHVAQGQSCAELGEETGAR